MNIAISGVVTEEQGAETIVLAGTDLFVAFDEQECGFNYIDSALVHIEAIHRASLRE
ncbi:hypothetical protein [Marinobacter sp. LV10R510-11A]|uniref:hypothetical protein n=1 Tax=Marinobacter sp. LV10R510-11A TaxID=1415568 RepID=UPI0012FD1959|nr:hypothetical protein [Marinobacter sp. LV10R510-11A]